MGPSWEKLGDDGSFEALLNKAEGCSKASTTSTNNNGVVLMIDN